MRGDVNDNTLGTIYGTYLALDMTLKTQANNRAVLVSPDLDNTAQYSFRYNYRRFGTGQGFVTISRRSFANATTPIVLIKLENTDFLDEWKMGQIQLNQLTNQTTNTYRLLIEGTSVSGIGRLLFDDFQLLNGPCPALPSNCSFRCDTTAGASQCIATSQICDFNNDCLDGTDENNCGYNCNFDQSQCNYTDPSAGAYKWRRQRAGAVISGGNSGPAFDHTTASPSGYYMIVLTNNGSIDERAHLLSPVLQQSSSTCELSFYYHMSGLNVGRLEVLLIEGIERSRLWSIDGTQGDRWHRALVRVGRYYRPFQIAFEARKTATTLADITIDDVEWIGCNLPLTNGTTTTCPDGQFKCQRGNNCIDLNRVCDYTDDCGDNSDESSTVCTRPTVMSG